MKKRYTKKQIVEAINYWKKQLRAGNYKRKLNESAGDAPRYTGKLVGYKWVLYADGNITENQYIQTFDSEQAAIQGAYDEYFAPEVDPDVFKWYGDSQAYGDALPSSREAFEYFKENKTVSSTDHTSFEMSVNIVKIKAADMQKLIDLVCNYPESPGLEEFDGNNFTAMDLYKFGDNDEWDEFNKLVV